LRNFGKAGEKRMFSTVFSFEKSLDVEEIQLFEFE